MSRAEIQDYIVECAQGCERCARNAYDSAADLDAPPWEWAAEKWSDRAFSAARCMQ